jgi:polar amino acid transport system substrate-binding protein
LATSALQSKRIDVVMSSMSDTKARQTGVDEDSGKKVGPGLDFVDYFNAGLAILVKKGNPQGIRTLDDLCGKTIALQQATTQERNAKDQQKKCKESGKGELKVLAFKNDPEALLQLKQGRAVADLNDFPVAAYNAKTSGGGNDFEIAGQQFDAGPFGIGIRKEDTQLRDAMMAAVQAIIDNDEYRKVLEKWNVTQGALPRATMNAGT